MGYILRIGYRHLESIRSQTLTVSMGFNWSKRQFNLEDWLQEQAPELVPHLPFLDGYEDIPKSFSHERSWHYAIILNSLLMKYESDSDDEDVNHRFMQSLVSTSMSDHADEDYAGSRRGGNWNPDPFSFRAGTILTLGALEEFERGTIRVLTGIEHSKHDYISETDPHFPRLQDFENTNPVFDALEKKQKTFTRGGRMKILKKYGLSKPTDEWAARLREAYNNRNQIAHGLAPVNVTLSMFPKTHYDAFTAMRWLAEEFRVHQNIQL